VFSEEFRFAQIGLAIFHLRVALPILYLVLYILTLKYTTFAFAGLCLNLGGDLRSRAARIHVVERLRLRLLNATTLSPTLNRGRILLNQGRIKLCVRFLELGVKRLNIARNRINLYK
jgi:hypothetical protein